MHVLPIRPKATIGEALKSFPDVDVIAVGENGTPSFLRGNFGSIANSGNAATLNDVVPQLTKIAPVLGLTVGNLRYLRTESDSLNYKHFFFDVTLNGRDVVGAMVIIHVDAKGRIYCVNGTVPDETRKIPTQSGVSLAEARKAIPASHATAKFARERLVYFLDSAHALHLAWEMPADVLNDGSFVDTVYVDAISGKHIETLSGIRGADHRNIYNANGAITYESSYNYNTTPPTFTGQTFYWPTTVTRPDGAGATSIDAVDNAYDYLGITYDYFHNTFGLDGMDGAGVAVYAAPNSLFRLNATSGSTVTQYYTGYNSFYVQLTLGNALYLGTGTGASGWSTSSATTVNASYGMAEALDVVAHEFTHGVSQHRGLGALGYVAGENAALNEGVSDIFGLMTKLYNRSYSQDSNTWIMGSTLSAPIRSLADPKSLGTAYADYYPAMNVNDDSHYNCTIAGLAYELFCQGGTHPRQSGKPTMTVVGIGVTEAQQVFYRALSVYAPTSCDFQSFKAATATAAYDRGGRNEENKVEFAWDAVGVPYNAYSARAINISTLTYNSGAATAGFVLSGSGSKSLLLRGVGPTLTSLGVSGVQSDPYLTLNHIVSGSATVIGTNDDWGLDPNASGIASTASAVGAFALPSGSKDAALLPSLSAGVYTAVISGVGGSTGTVLIEAYDTNSGVDPHLVNISTLGQVTSSQPMIAGFVISGSANKKVLIRGVGPALTAQGVSGVLSNPTLTINWQETGASSHQIYSNTGWGNAWNSSDIASAASTVGAFSLSSGSADCALLVSLPPGIYTAVVSGVSGGTGNAMVEVYDVQ